MNYVVPASVLAPLTTGVFNFGFLNKAFKILCYYFVTSLCVNITTAVLSYHHIPNLIFFHLYTPVESIFLFLFFREILLTGFIRKMTGFLIVVFPLYCIVAYLFLQKEDKFNTYAHSIEALIFIILSICFFIEQSLKQDETIRWIDFPLNWLISGFLLYFSSTFFLYAFSNVLINNYSRATNVFIWEVHGIIIIITNLLWTIGFYKCRK